MLNFASLIILISGQNPRILAGRREASEDCLCSEISFLLKSSWAKKKSCKHKGGGKTYDPRKEETKKARKTTTQRKHTSVGVTEDLRLNVAEISQSIEVAPETRRSCKEEINC